MKSHTSSLIEQLGIHDLSEQDLEQVVGAQGYRHDHDYGRNDHNHDWYYGHKHGWDHDHHHRWDSKRGWCYTSGWYR
ncbi:hypothetical protein KSC_040930 [Ktedonobacter sp. SOSP1-52]|uniref:hypothetical protein n=1 Tax=Ktedonobacter sp. SOSP1-52 TaxID=2778366 RepID=UPI00191612ED|nr:hypothetical protein [Ktedonobacter sp. SOSP1-52]GHO65201.1 hypothetical protein KSC_040930 [Ktedonobacter sp. SOSP1-52]